MGATDQYQFKETEQFYSLYLFQNGGFVFGKGTTFVKQLDVQSGSKGCLLLYTYPLDSQKNLCFEWEGSLYRFLCLCFLLSPALLVFMKLLRVPRALLRKLKVRLIIYLDNILMVAASKEELQIGRNIDFSITTSRLHNQCKKAVLCLTKILELLGIIINSIKMELSLSEGKLQKILMQCQKTLDQN